jgi:septal ring factor EnvC (AmiA/AmiB activator)
VQINDLMTQRCNALSSALEDRMEEVAKIDDELRLTTMRLQTLNLQIEDQEKKIKTLRRIIILQKTIIIIESAALLVAGTLIVLNTKD